MIKQFEIILEAFKHPKVKLINKAFRKQTLLFDFETDIGVQFNGYNSLYDYQEYVDKCFLKSKDVIQQKMATEMSYPLQLKQNLDLLKFEIKTFRKMHFHLNNEELMISRIEFIKNSLPIKTNDGYLKKNTSIF